MEGKKVGFKAEEVGEIFKRFMCLIVDDSENVMVDIHESENSIIFELAVPGDEYGKAIGKNGKLANALRTMIRAVAGSFDKRLVLEFSARKTKN